MQSVLPVLLGYLSYFLPALVVGAIAYYFFKIHVENEENRRRYLLRKEIGRAHV